MAEKQCKDCAHYLQHYILRDARLVRIYCGHCVNSRARRKAPDAKACEDFLQGTEDTQAAANRQYLSKKLLDYILQLELLPDIIENVPNEM
jgi:hypothetical protein